MTYAGNRIINANNIISVVLILIFSVVVIVSPEPEVTSELKNWYVYLIIILFVFTISSSSAFYFEITGDELIINNYLLPFVNIEYKLSEITKIQIDTSSKSLAKARIKVIRGDQIAIGFNAASLRIQDWQLFVSDLSSKKITVVIESYSLKGKIGIPE